MGQWTAAMRTGAYDAAWALSARTLAERDPATRDDPAKPYHLRWVWDGRSLDDAHVLVRCYHGLGDTLQFARFLPLLADRAASVTVEVQPCLRDLLATSLARDGLTFVPFDTAHPLPPAEVDIEIAELDSALRVAPAEPPTPYVHALPAALAGGTIGLCYGASDWDAERSVPSKLFAPLCRQVPTVTLMPQPTELAVLNPEGCSLDVADTAALVAGVDLVITVDTMIAHLAGAMGRPVWLLLKAEPDWRWPIDRRESDWYPSLRIYAQSRAGDWTDVVDRVRREIADRYAIRPESVS